MSLKMSVAEREAFLADLHVGVISIEQAGASPLSVPIWYDFRPDTGVWVLTSPTSHKGRALEVSGRFTLVAQVETPPIYQYVSVEGPIVSVETADRERHSRPMARRYLGDKGGDMYVDSQGDDGSHVYTMRPERWRTVDYRKLTNAG